MATFADLMTQDQGARDALALRTRMMPPSSMMSAFGQLLTAQENSIINLQFPYGIISEHVVASGTLGGFVTSSNGFAIVAVNTGSNAQATLESLDAARYVAGQGISVKFACVFSSGLSGSRQEIGVGDDRDGFFFGYDGTSFGVCVRRDQVDTWVSTGSWNQDPMDGTGPSAMTLDPTKGNVFRVGYQWLGFGNIQFHVEDGETGFLVPVHHVKYPNVNTVPSITNPTLPVRIHTRNFGNVVPIALSASSLGAYSEGPLPDSGMNRSTNNVKTGITTETAVLSIKNDITFLGKRNRMRVKLDLISLSNRGNQQSSFRVVVNPTLGGSPSFTNLSSSVSPMSVDTAGTTVTGGRSIFNFELAAATTAISDVSSLAIRMNPGDILTVAASSSASTTAAVGLSWRE